MKANGDMKCNRHKFRTSSTDAAADKNCFLVGKLLHQPTDPFIKTQDLGYLDCFSDH